MAEIKKALSTTLKDIDDQRIDGEKYLVGIDDATRSLVFDDTQTFTRSQTTVEKIANLAEVIATLEARIVALETK